MLKKFASLPLLVLGLIVVSFFWAFSSDFLRPIIQPAVAQVNSSPLTGWGWSSTIGWISFRGTLPGRQFGVDITGDPGSTPRPLSGYAWSNNIGWIRFGPSDPPETFPSGNGTTPVYAEWVEDTVPNDRINGFLHGWTRACSVFAPGQNTVLDCGGDDILKPPEQRGGWDGWISLAGTALSGGSYGIRDITIPGEDFNRLAGFAWGDLNVSWFNFGLNRGQDDCELGDPDCEPCLPNDPDCPPPPPPPPCEPGDPGYPDCPPPPPPCENYCDCNVCGGETNFMVQCEASFPNPSAPNTVTWTAYPSPLSPPGGGSYAYSWSLPDGNPSSGTGNPINATYDSFPDARNYLATVTAALGNNSRTGTCPVTIPGTAEPGLCDEDGNCEPDEGEDCACLDCAGPPACPPGGNNPGTLTTVPPDGASISISTTYSGTRLTSTPGQVLYSGGVNVSSAQLVLEKIVLDVEGTQLEDLIYSAFGGFPPPAAIPQCRLYKSTEPQPDTYSSCVGVVYEPITAGENFIFDVSLPTGFLSPDDRVTLDNVNNQTYYVKFKATVQYGNSNPGEGETDPLFYPFVFNVTDWGQ